MKRGIKLLKQNIGLYLLTFANVLYAINHEFNCLTYIALGLSILTFIFNIMKLRGR